MSYSDLGSFGGSKQEIKGIPLVNEFSSAIQKGQAQTSNSDLDYDQLYKYATKSPEALIPMWTIISDIESDGFYLENHDSGTGRNKKQKAERFLRRNYFKTEIEPALLWDAMITGDYYLYTPRVGESELKATINSIVDKHNFNRPDFMRNYIYAKYAMTDDFSFGASDLVPLASSSMKIKHDRHQKIMEYEQKVSGMKEVFKPDEIIHGKLMPLNGKVYGFTPMKSIISELQILSGAKDIIGYSFEEGGNPPMLYNLKDKDPNSPDYKLMTSLLRQWKKSRNRNRGLVVTGDVEVQDISRSMKDMMYRELMDKMAEICMMVWGVPPSKMGMTKSESGGYDSGLATEGYYKRISNLQEWFYGKLNKEFMISEFGVEIVPKKTYLQDEVRESQTMLQKLQSAKMMMDMNLVKPEYIVEKMLHIPERYRGSLEIVQEPQNPRSPENPPKTNIQEEMDNMRSETQMNKSITEIKSTARYIEGLIENLKDEQRITKENYNEYKAELEDKKEEYLDKVDGYTTRVRRELKNEISDVAKESFDKELGEFKKFREKIEGMFDEGEDN